MTQFRLPALCLTSLLLAPTLVGCGEDEIAYQPVPPVEGIKASLPAVPTIQEKPIKDGDAYTVWGASFHLRNRVHTKEVADTTLSVTGYIVKTNLLDAPECAVHKGGEADPEGCRPPVPTFWIADSKDADLKDAMKVMGWASNYAQIYDSIEEFDKDPDEAEHMDSVWGVPMPKPIPAIGAKVKVKGQYSTAFTMASGGIESDPVMGILTYREVEYVEKAPELAILPGMKERKPKKS